MKKIFVTMMTIACLLAISCNKESKMKESFEGTLSFEGFSIQQDDELDTKATSEASGNYEIEILDAEGNSVLVTSYSAVQNGGSMISLPAGHYRLCARSQSAVPVAAFEQPVYGVEKEFDIEAGGTTPVGNLTCTLLSCKVTVSYSDDFLAMVTGSGSASVEVTAGYPLEYALSYDAGKASYDYSAGYFSVNNGLSTTLVVTFKGSIDGKSQKMTKTIAGIQPKQWRQIKFIKKVDEEGNATFDIVINDFVTDAELNGFEDDVAEAVIGDDPDAPKGDGGITLDFDYEAGCDAGFTDLGNIIIPPLGENGETTINLHLKATVPNGIKKFTVDIESTSATFTAAVAAADATTLDLIYPTEDNEIIFQVVPFPHGTELLGQTSVQFDMTSAQAAIVAYQGVHTFTMNITDEQGCRNSIPLVMVVE
ncbi:MAG: DUF4493 domain-containing protein [Candidatus Cryptobacteroides sp.]